VLVRSTPTALCRCGQLTLVSACAIYRHSLMFVPSTHTAQITAYKMAMHPLIGVTEED